MYVYNANVQRKKTKQILNYLKDISRIELILLIKFIKILQVTYKLSKL